MTADRKELAERLAELTLARKALDAMIDRIPSDRGGEPMDTVCALRMSVKRMEEFLTRPHAAPDVTEAVRCATHGYWCHVCHVSVSAMCRTNTGNHTTCGKELTWTKLATVPVEALSHPDLQDRVKAETLTAVRERLNMAVRKLALTNTIGNNHAYISDAETAIDQAQAVISRILAALHPDTLTAAVHKGEIERLARASAMGDWRRAMKGVETEFQESDAEWVERMWPRHVENVKDILLAIAERPSCDPVVKAREVRAAAREDGGGQ